MQVLLLAATALVVEDFLDRKTYRVTVPGWALYCPVGAEELYGCEAV